MDFERLKLLCERAVSLPPIPASVFRLMEILEGDGASAAQIAAITAADPMLCTKILRAANDQLGFGGLSRITSVQGAVLRLGHKAVRSIAVSLGVQAMFNSKNKECLFDSLCYARHSILVGLLARYVYTRRLMKGPVPDNMAAEEVFASGVLHDLPVALLAWVGPTAYDRVHLYCKAHRVTIEHGFEDVFEGSIRDLGTRAIKTWGLPEAFSLTTEFVDRPIEATKYQIPIMAINYASAVADSTVTEKKGFASAPWSCAVDVSEAVQEEVGLAAEELEIVFPKVLSQVEFYLPTPVMSGSVFIGGRRVA